MRHSNSAFPMSVLNLIFPSATMEQVPLFHCLNCQNSETKGPYILRKKNYKYGARGEPDRITYIQQFTVALHERALTGVISCFSTRGLAGEADEICTRIVGHVWEATWFRFTYGWFSLEGQCLMLSLFNQIQDEKCPEE